MSTDSKLAATAAAAATASAPSTASAASTASTSSIAIPQSMKAVVMKAAGAPANMSVGDAPTPAPKAGEILIRVRATAVNRADTLQRKGLYPPPSGASTLMGLEAAGEVVAVGPTDTAATDAKAASATSAAPVWSVGDRVMALLPGGGYAQYCVASASHAMAIPKGMSFTTAAAIPETFLTAFQLLRFIGNAKAGETVLIHAGASGVGTSAIQLCRHFGVTAIVTAGSDDKIARCVKLGAAFGVNYKTQPKFSGPILERVKGGVDLVLDCVGATYATENLNALKGGDGRWVLYGTMGGGEVDKFPLSAILRKRVTLHGTTLRNRSVAYKADLVAAFQQAVGTAFQTAAQTDTASAATPAAAAATALGPVIDHVFPSLSSMAEAHTRMEADANFGKIVVAVE